MAQAQGPGPGDNRIAEFGLEGFWVGKVTGLWKHCAGSGPGPLKGVQGLRV